MAIDRRTANRIPYRAPRSISVARGRKLPGSPAAGTRAYVPNRRESYEFDRVLASPYLYSSNDGLLGRRTTLNTLMFWFAEAREREIASKRQRTKIALSNRAPPKSQLVKRALRRSAAEKSHCLRETLSKTALRRSEPDKSTLSSRMSQKWRPARRVLFSRSVRIFIGRKSIRCISRNPKEIIAFGRRIK